MKLRTLLAILTAFLLVIGTGCLTAPYDAANADHGHPKYGNQNATGTAQYLAQPRFEIRNVHAESVSAGDSTRVYFDLRNTGNAAGSTNLRLIVNGISYAADNFQVPAGDEKRDLSFPLAVTWTGQRQVWIGGDQTSSKIEVEGYAPVMYATLSNPHNDYGCRDDNSNNFTGYFFITAEITNSGRGKLTDATLSLLVAKNSYTNDDGFTEFLRMYTAERKGQSGYEYLHIDDLAPGETRTFTDLQVFRDKHFNDTCGNENTYQAKLEVDGAYMQTYTSNIKEFDA